jgi:hypothetical protein
MRRSLPSSHSVNGSSKWGKSLLQCPTSPQRAPRRMRAQRHRYILPRSTMPTPMIQGRCNNA